MISVILPAVRDQEHAQTIVDRLWKNENVSDVVVASPNFSIERATMFRDTYAGSARVLAQAYQFTHAQSLYVAWLSEICYPEEGALDAMMAYLEKQAGPHIAEFRTAPSVTPGHYRVCTILGRQYARWGMLSRRTIEAIGGFFDAAYVAHYGDVDLSLRCWGVGGAVSTATAAVVELRGHWHISTAPNSVDESTFLEHWRGEYPSMRADNTAEWNVDREMPLCT